MIALLIRLAALEDAKEYRPIIVAAFPWGFDKWYGTNWQGDQEIRTLLLRLGGMQLKARTKFLQVNSLNIFV